MDIKELKTSIRKDYLARRASLPPEEKARRDRKICQYILSSASFRYAETVLAYYPREHEIDILPVLREAIKMGKRVALPRCDGEHHMTYRFVSSLDGLTPGMYGIFEPEESAPAFSENVGHAALCLVPGVVFDTRGYRIGYGGGYYDRFLHSFGGSVAGVVYREFILPSLPFGRYDLALPVMITETGVVCSK